jgi:hypothetical protein
MLHPRPVDASHLLAHEPGELAWDFSASQQASTQSVGVEETKTSW